jgi:hypothetical protein
MKLMILFVMAIVGHLSFAQETDDPSRPTMGSTGQLFTITITPKSRKLEISLAGKSAASLDPEKLIVLGKVFPVKGEPKALRIQTSEGHFELMDPIAPDSSLEFDVTDKASKKSEKLHVKTGAKL